ncbi:Uu.00g133080.m01.CDS01 [Anthostomella pinea]|uniref:Uu.00g133080.m01.CDS01 n=1 Tax=Anthostomella pinea TaxID=933095 RepID=A0AAI8VTR6_9PEZI|nr:Uu.00g133080.m01.CDS01 [Anthostomella pinea]
MQIKNTPILALASLASAQNLTGNSSLSDMLGSVGSLSSLNVTLLAPNNDALASINGAGNSMLGDPSYVQALLSYHVLNGSYSNASFSNSSMFIPTMLTNSTFSNVTGGQRVEARMSGHNITFLSAEKQNISSISTLNFTGGMIHIVDGFLSIPGNVTDTLANANLTAASGAITSTNLSRPISSMSYVHFRVLYFTIFPCPERESPLLARIKAFAPETRIMTPLFFSKPSKRSNYRDVTIFAPNNAAFNAIGSIVSILTPQQQNSIIGYHVVNGTVDYSSQMLRRGNSTLKTLTGPDITISVVDGHIFVNAARVTVADILCENGVIHVVDQVLNSENAATSPNATATTATPAFTGASTGTAGVPFTSGVSTATTTYPAATSAGGDDSSATSSSSDGLAMPMKTGAVGVVALFGGAAALMNM